MLPDLGKYAGPVLGSYAVALVLVALLVVASLIARRRVKHALAAVEARMERRDVLARMEEQK